MRYLKPRKSLIKINNEIYDLRFTLDVIDEIQDKAQLPMPEIIAMLTEDKSKKLAACVLLKYLTGQVIEMEDDKLDYYSVILLNTYIEQINSKEIPGQNKVPPNGKEYQFIDVEHWFYIGTVVLGQPKIEVWDMLLGELRTLHNEHAKYNGWIKEEKEESLLSI